MDFTSSSSTSSLQSVKERIREKLNGSLKAVKLQTSLAAKIKTKTLNNSSILKLSLKHNNKALACALTAEREKSRRLGNDKMFLQKEVKMLHFQNALLRQNLSIVNKMLKDIDVFMNINLPTAIEISSNMESSDRLSLNETKSHRFSQQSALTLDEDQGYRLTGMALRVPAYSVEQQKRNSHQTILVNEGNHPIVPPSQIATVREICDKLDEPDLHTLNVSSKEDLSLCHENTSRDSLSNVNVSNSILPLDEVFNFSNRNAQSGGFVTKRKKRSTVSHSSTVSKKSETNQTRSSMSMSSPSSIHWEINTDVTVLPHSGHIGSSGAERSYIDCALQKDRLSTTSHCTSLSQKLETDQSSDIVKDISNGLYEEQAIQSTNEQDLLLNEERDHHIVDGYLGQEKTVYEADMEITSSESTSIVAVLPKNKTQASKNKTGIPVKQSGTLRKVKSVREKTKRNGSSVVQQVNDLPNNEKGDTANKSIENLTSHRHDDRKTYVLPGPVVQEKLDVLESGTQSNIEASASRESFVEEQIFSNNTIVLNGIKSELTFTIENNCETEAGNVADLAHKKRKSKIIQEASRMESSRKKKRKMHRNSKDQEYLAEENDHKIESTEQIDSSKEINPMTSIRLKNEEPKIRRETYVVSATEHPATNYLISKLQGVNYRRETFVIPEPNPLVSVTLKTSVSEERIDTFVEPQNDVNSLVPKDVSHKTKIRSDTKTLDSENEHCDPISDPEDAYDGKDHVSSCSEKNASPGLFYELDKRKTHILPSKQDDFRGEKATLVRESFMNLTSSHSNKTSRFPDVMTSKNDTFMLDMVSESILDNTMEFSSFAEFPSATDPESTFTIDVSLKSVPAPEFPVSEDCNNKELSHLSNNINPLDENDNGHQKDTSETGINQQFKVEDQSMEIQESATKPFQDLTNKSLGSTKQSPKSSSEEEESRGHTRRRRNPVNYKEPSLGKKLRRGDQHTDTAFLSQPVIKVKGKQGRGRNKKVKSEECTTEET